MNSCREEHHCRTLPFDILLTLPCSFLKTHALSLSKVGMFKKLDRRHPYLHRHSCIINIYPHRMHHTVRNLRPLFLRRRKTLLPPVEAIRCKNPCVRFFFMTLLLTPPCKSISTASVAGSSYDTSTRLPGAIKR